MTDKYLDLAQPTYYLNALNLRLQNDDQMEQVFQQAREEAIEQYQALPWYQKNPDLLLPVLLIGAGLFQYVLRKWILPVSDRTINELESQMPTQGLFYHPSFGLALMIIGLVVLTIVMLVHFL